MEYLIHNFWRIKWMWCKAKRKIELVWTSYTTRMILRSGDSETDTADMIRIALAGVNQIRTLQQFRSFIVLLHHDFVLPQSDIARYSESLSNTCTRNR